MNLKLAWTVKAATGSDRNQAQGRCNVLSYCYFHYVADPWYQVKDPQLISQRCQLSTFLRIILKNN